jgi:hypothetical protein
MPGVCPDLRGSARAGDGNRKPSRWSFVTGVKYESPAEDNSQLVLPFCRRLCTESREFCEGTQWHAGKGAF